MSERATVDGTDGQVNWKPTGDGVRIYDEENQEAWVEVSLDAGVPPEKRLYSICPECGLVAPRRTGPGRGMVCGDCGAEVDCR